VSLRGLISLAAASSLLLGGCAVFDPAAAVVGSHKIEDEDFRADLGFISADPRFAEQTPGVDPAAQREQLTRDVLTFLIQQEVIEERAREEGIEAEQAEIEELLSQQIQALGGEEALRRQIRESGTSLADVRDLLRAQIVRDKVAQAVVEQEISDEELMADYEDRIREFTSVHVAHILVRSEETAVRLARRATARSFAGLARRFSQDPGSAANGGDLDTHPVTDFVESFANAVLEIPVGEIGGPVETEFGFHVIRVLERETIPFEEIRGQLVQERAGQVFRGWLLARLGEVDIRVNPRYGIYDPRTGQVVERTATTPLPGPQVTP
jgi:parvulin-like peptidyl-prolyl isomerase